MLQLVKILALAALGLGAVACQSSRFTTAGFHLPADGDCARGKAAFVALQCNSCHEIRGADLPKPNAFPTAPVVLGGEVVQRLSDAYLVTSMLDPNRDLALSARRQDSAGGRSRMPSYANRLSAREMIDLVAFLQSVYTVQRWHPEYVYPG